MIEKYLEKMKGNESYAAKYDERAKEIQMRAKKLIYRYNNTEPDMEAERKAILQNLFYNDEINICIEPPFHCDYGFNIKFQGLTVINYNCSILDTSPVYIGENTFIAPNVCITCAGHAIHPQDRNSIVTSKPIFIGKDVWIGANATILGGVHIGSGSITEADRLHMRDTMETV